jgi:ATP-dependent RNA helicase DDX41
MAVELFSAGQEDVLIGTDVASKGLDFPDIQHVINYDMPKEIENYSTILQIQLFMFCSV